MGLAVSEVSVKLGRAGLFKGNLVSYIDMQGCNLKCLNCTRGKASKTKVRIDNILKSINRQRTKYAYLGGGEPLLQSETMILVYELVKKGLQVVVETNGTIEIGEALYNRSYYYCINMRTPSSSNTILNNFANLDKIQYNDEVRFNILDINDYNYAKKIINRHHIIGRYSLAVYDKDLLELVVDWACEDMLTHVRIDYIS